VRLAPQDSNQQAGLREWVCSRSCPPQAGNLHARGGPRRVPLPLQETQSNHAPTVSRCDQPARLAQLADPGSSPSSTRVSGVQAEHLPWPSMSIRKRPLISGRIPAARGRGATTPQCCSAWRAREEEQVQHRLNLQGDLRAAPPSGRMERQAQLAAPGHQQFRSSLARGQRRLHALSGLVRSSVPDVAERPPNPRTARGSRA